MHFGPFSLPHNFQGNSPLNLILPRYLKSICHVGEKNWGVLHLPVACGIFNGNKTRDKKSRCPQTLSHKRLRDDTRPSLLLVYQVANCCEVLTKWPQGCLSLLVVMATIKASTIPPHSANAQAGNCPPIIKLLAWRKKSHQRYHFLQKRPFVFPLPMRLQIHTSLIKYKSI